jgi:hypothetical protein
MDTYTESISGSANGTEVANASNAGETTKESRRSFGVPCAATSSPQKSRIDFPCGLIVI